MNEVFWGIGKIYDRYSSKYVWSCRMIEHYFDPATDSLSLCMSWCTFLHLYYLSWSISESHHLFFADLLMYKFTFNVMYWLDSCLTEPASSTSPIVHVIFALKISNTIYSLQTVNIIEKYLIFLCDLLVWILLPRLN